MRIFIDTNVILDVALKREPFLADSRQSLSWSFENAETTLIAWHTVSNAYYILRSKLDDQSARESLLQLLCWVEIAPTSSPIAHEALSLQGGDAEDQLQASCAQAAASDLIVTRNVKDFSSSSVRAITPTVFLAEAKNP